MKDQQPAAPVGADPVTEADADDLAAVARAKVFFGHMSVGMNVLDGVAGLYAAGEGPAPDIVEVTGSEGTTAHSGQGGGYLAHAYIGENGDPIGKIADFDARIRAGLGREVDIAFMKFCYVDLTTATDVNALFTRYRNTMAALERDFPDVTFLHVTTPVTTEPSLKAKVKALLGRNDGMNPADNAARERFNELLRREYRHDRLFDLAAVESTRPDGSRVTGTSEGSRYFAMYPGYAADAGHLNATGSRVAAAGLLHLVARTAQERDR